MTLTHDTGTSHVREWSAVRISIRVACCLCVQASGPPPPQKKMLFLFSLSFALVLPKRRNATPKASSSSELLKLIYTLPLDCGMMMLHAHVTYVDLDDDQGDKV